MEQQEEISEYSSQKAGYLSTFFSLYLAQAVPMSFFTTALQVILREQAVPLSLIGLLQIVKLPWILKVFWSPAIDRHCQTVGDYKRTIIGAEIVYALLILVTSLFAHHSAPLLPPAHRAYPSCFGCFGHTRHRYRRLGHTLFGTSSTRIAQQHAVDGQLWWQSFGQRSALDGAPFLWLEPRNPVLKSVCSHRHGAAMAA